MNNSVGVVVPTYNCRQFLSDCLESLLGQSYPPAQIVICDDCSQDGTQEIILEYQQKHPEIIESILNKKNLGIPRNFNNGLRAINTDYISLIAGDDFWHKDKLMLELEALGQNPECRWAYSNSCLVDKEGNLMGPFRREYDGAEGNIVFEVLTHEMTLRNWTIEKGLLDSIGLFDESFHIFEDWDFKIRLAKTAKVAHVNHDSVFYRKHGKGISNSPGNIYFENLNQIYLKHKALIETLPKERKFLVIKKQRKDMLLHVNRFLEGPNKISFLDKCRYVFLKKYLHLHTR